MTRSWYEIKAKKESADIYIYDEIGYFGISANAFIRELQALAELPLNVYINSPGGEVFDGIAIYEALGRHEGAVNVVVDALAASIASVIAQAGNRRTMAKAATMMIHEPWGLAIGDSEEMAKMGGTLDLIGDQIAGIYARHAGGTVEEWRSRMAEETWYKADEAVAAGLADAVGAQAENAYTGRVFNLSKFTKVPEWVNRVDDQPASDPPNPAVQDGQEEETDMAELSDIRRALGIDEESGDILAAITGLHAQVTTLNQTLQADAPDKGEIAQLRLELSEANQRIIALDNERNAELLSLRQKVHNMEAEARVDKAISAGRVTPANRGIALKVALGQSEEEFNRFIAALPKVDLGERGSAGSLELEAFEPTQQEVEIAKQMGTWDDNDAGGSRIRLMRAKGAKIPEPKEAK